MIAPFTTIDQGDGSRVAEPRRTIVRDDGEWKALWAVHAGPDAATPAIDFTSPVAIACTRMFPIAVASTGPAIRRSIGGTRG